MPRGVPVPVYEGFQLGEDTVLVGVGVQRQGAGDHRGPFPEVGFERSPFFLSAKGREQKVGQVLLVGISSGRFGQPAVVFPESVEQLECLRRGPAAGAGHGRVLPVGRGRARCRNNASGVQPHWPCPDSWEARTDSMTPAAGAW
jgi:hypothetical protein